MKEGKRGTKESQERKERDKIKERKRERDIERILEKDKNTVFMFFLWVF